MENSKNLKLNISSKKRAIGYVRVSTEEQANEGNSKDSQRDYINSYCLNNGYELIDIIDEYKSASKQSFKDTSIENDVSSVLGNRPELLKIISSAKLSNFEYLIVNTRDRLARNLEAFVSIKFFLEKKGIKIAFANPNESINTQNKGLESFIELILASVAELEANLISERVRSGLAQKAKNGYWPGGHSPYGYATKECENSKNKVLVKSILEERYIQKIFNLHNQYGYSYRKIAAILNEIDGDNLWNKNKIESIIKTKTYTGKVSWGRRSNRTFNSTSDSLICSNYDKNLEIIDVESWERAQKIRLKKDKIKDSKYFNTTFLLRDKLICAKCNNKMKTKNYGKYRNGNQREGVYRCDCTKHLINNEKMIFKKSIVENDFIEKFLINLNPEKIAELWYYYSKTKERVTNENKLKIKRIKNQINIRINKIKELENLLNDSSNKSIFESLEFQKIILSNEIKLLESYKDELENPPNNFFQNESQLKSALNKLFKVDFKYLSNERKRMIIDILIDKIIINKVPKKKIDILDSKDTDKNYDIKMTIYTTTNIDIL